jgi:hypothetical protein
MATCPAGHETNQTDFCDICGLPVAGGAPATTVAPTPAQPQAAPVVTCPNCKTPNVADALFCEACGFDFTTGTLPAPVTPSWPTLVRPEQDVAAKPVTQVAPVSQPSPASQPTPASQPSPEQADASQPDPAPGAPEAAQADPSVPSVPEGGAPAVAPQQLKPPAVDWIAELWIDPDWYAAQGSTDPMPSPGLPDIVPLVKEKSLVGRVSQSRGIFPDVDCELDSGVSRRHAMLTTDGNRWWIEDLNSANGTFVGAAAGPLPAMPIPQGRVELSPGQRIYVGAWTRIVIRKATEDERAAFAG